MKKLKAAILGLAHCHTIIFYNEFKKFADEIEIIGMADVPDPENNREESLEARLAANLNIPDRPKLYPNVDVLLDQKPDIACITSDIADHPMLVKKCMERGIYTIIEKPMACSQEDGLAISRAAESCPDHLFVNWPIAWYPTFRKARELARSGAVGRLLRICYRTPQTKGPYGCKTTDFESVKGAWCYRHDRGGGSLIDYAGYGFFLASWFFEEAPKMVYGLKKNFALPFSDTEDYSSFILDFGDKVGQAEGSWSTHCSGEIPTGPIVYGEEGTIVADRFDDTVKLYRKFKPYVPSFPPDEIYRPMPLDERDCVVGSVMDLILKGKPVPESITMKINRLAQGGLSAGILSCDTGKPEIVKL